MQLIRIGLALVGGIGLAAVIASALVADAVLREIERNRPPFGREEP